MSAEWITGDVFDVLATLPDQSVHSVITSPPYWRKRRYLSVDHPQADKEIGQEPTPGAFLATLLRLTDDLWRIVRDDGTIWINLGDTASGSGGSGGDYNMGGQREGQAKYAGSALAPNDMGRWSNSYPPGGRNDIPKPKSVCWIPELFGASLAYGRNLITGEPCRQWITRPQITWCKPSPTPGEIIDKFREATELIVWASKEPHYYFDIDAVRLPPIPENQRTTWNQNGPKAAAARVAGRDVSGHERYTKRTTNPKGAPPLTWWVVNSSGYAGAHFATFPPELIRRPVIASCPPGGTILDPFGGSGTTAAVATGNGRNCISIDFDERNADLARERVGMFLTISDDPSWTSDALAGVLPAGAIPGDGPPARTGIPPGETRRPPAALPVTSPPRPPRPGTEPTIAPAVQDGQKPGDGRSTTTNRNAPALPTQPGA